MRLFSYALLHIARNVKPTLITLCSYFCVLAVIMSVQQSAQSRQQNLTDMAAAMEVQGEVTDGGGYVNQGLDMSSFYALLFLDESELLSCYVKNVNVRGEFQGKALLLLPDSDPVELESCTLVTITREHADENLKFGEGMTYMEGYDDSVWMTAGNVCAVTEDMLGVLRMDEDGRQYMDFQAAFVRPSDFSVKTLVFSLQVIAFAQDGTNTVYAPFFTVYNACDEKNASFNQDSLSFTVADNSKMDVLRHSASTFFQDARARQASGGFSMVIKDSRYLKLTREAEKNLATMQLLRPILYLCALGAGVMLVVMQMRSRKKEMAVIRSLGAGRIHVMVQSILEYALICLPVTLFALLVWRELSPMTVFGVWLAFMAGALCTIVRFSMIPLVKQIRELEE